MPWTPAPDLWVMVMQMKLSSRTRMGAIRKALVASMIVVALAVTGCGGSSRRTSPTAPAAPSQQASRQPEPAHPSGSIGVSIPTYPRAGESYIPRRYTCDGADVSLPVQWSGIPKGTAELAVFIVNLLPVHSKLFFDWAVTNLSPQSHGISAGALPPGAIVGRNSFGSTSYLICPAKRKIREYFFVKVAALPRPLAARPGFDAEKVYREAERSARLVGLGGGGYKRL